MLLALPIGILIGLSLGALGGGGSILTVPALVNLLGESPHSATTSSLIIVGVTAVASTAVHLQAGRVRVRSGIVFGVLGAGGAFAGSRLSASIDPSALLVAFSVLMAAAAAAMLYRQRSGAAPVPEGPAAAGPPAPGRALGDPDCHDGHDDHAGSGGGVAVRHSPPRPASTARAAPPVSPEGMEANLFFTFFGLDAIHKARHEHIKLATVGNPGLHLATWAGGLPGVSSVMTHYMARKMDALDIPSVPEFVEMIADTGAGLYACKASADLFGLAKSDFIDQVKDIITVGEFYDLAAGGEIIFT